MSRRILLTIASIIIFVSLVVTAVWRSPDLSGTSWRLTAINGVPPASEATLAVDADGTSVSGMTGCGPFTAQLERTADTARFIDVTPDDVACEDGALFLVVLEEASAVHLVGDRLTITAASGRLGNRTLTFEPQ